MLKKILFVLLSTRVVSALAYDKPNSVAYYPSVKAYFISNLAGKSITKLDSNFDKTDIITGLTRPKDILFASFGPYNGLLILDSNEVKVYDADGYSYIASFKVPGALDLEDAEADKTTPGTFYISDPQAHKIFKVVVGPAPFYTPAFTTLNSTVRNPKALLFDSKNRLLVTTDTTKSAVYSINTSTGNASLVNITSIDNINSIEEDLQGNFYATSWGDSYFYRLDKDFKNAKDLAMYSKPSGLFFNKDYDVIVLACSNCNKVEFYKLHMVYINDVDTAKCPGDTFNVNVSLQFKGKGTYNSSNTFYVELSDANGKFSSAILIGSEKTTTEPSNYRVVLPPNKRFYGSNYKIRVRSTSPAFYSLNEMEIVVPFVPTIYVSDKDTLYYCSSNQVKLGKPKDEDSLLVNYLWYEDGKLQSNNTSQMEVSKTGMHKFKFVKQTKSIGCSISDSVVTEQKSGSISIPFKDTILVCQRQNATIGGDSIANTTILWTDKSDIGFLQTKYKFEIPGNVNINKTYTASVKSIQFGCEISKDIHLIYRNNPKYELGFYWRYRVCYDSSVSLLPRYVSGDTQNISFQWEPKDFLNNQNIKTPVYSSTLNQDYVKTYTGWTKDTVSNCSDSFTAKVINYKTIKPQIEQVSFTDTINIKNRDTLYSYVYRVYFQDSSSYNDYILDSSFICPGFNKAKYIIVNFSNKGNCYSKSDTLFLKHYVGVKNLKSSPFGIYPNPADDVLFIKDFKGDLSKAEVFIYDLVGQKILNLNPRKNGEIDIQNLVPGMYSIRVNFEDQLFNNIFIKH